MDNDDVNSPEFKFRGNLSILRKEKKSYEHVMDIDCVKIVIIINRNKE